MSTKAPSQIQEYPADSLEKKIYALASEVPTLEPNDQIRLGYCLWAWWTDRAGTLKQAVHAAGVRSNLTEDEITKLVEEGLRRAGLFEVPSKQ